MYQQPCSGGAIAALKENSFEVGKCKVSNDNQLFVLVVLVNLPLKAYRFSCNGYTASLLSTRLIKCILGPSHIFTPSVRKIHFSPPVLTDREKGFGSLEVYLHERYAGTGHHSDIVTYW